MKKTIKYSKATVLILIVTAILALAVYGLISLINILKNNDNENILEKHEVISSNVPIPTDIVEGDNEYITINVIENKEITVSFNDNKLTINNPGINYEFKNITKSNDLLIFIPGKTCNKLGYTEVHSSDFINGYLINEEENGIFISVDVNDPFTVIKEEKGDSVIFGLVKQKNTDVLEYRNDLSRIYLNIQNARLSSETDSFIKRYTEIYNEENLTHTITIEKSFMPVLENELLIFNDGMVKSIEIINRETDIQLIIKVYDKIIIYPNTRDYDAAFTFIRPNEEDAHLIVLDPGHGGIDGGTTSADESILEKNIVVNICSMIADKLSDSGFKVINLREEDIFLGLMERTDIANLAKADAIVSVHANSYKAEYVNGTTTLYKTSERLAEAIQSSVISETGANDMGTVKMTNLSILNRAEMDSVIIETGFLSNEAEAILLNSHEYQEKVANGIANGIELYFKGD